MSALKSHIVIHCSATRPSQDWQAADIDRLHRSKGWRMNGYHIVITRSGDIQSADSGHKCRPLSEAGAHVGDCGPGWNARAIGICLIGGVDDDLRPDANYTPEQWTALAAVVKDLTQGFRIPTDRVIGHRDLIRQTGAPAKACPCFDVSEWLIGGSPFTRDGYDALSEPKDPLGVPKTHVVREGESLWRIAQTYGLSIEHLRRHNAGVRASDMIQPGQKLRLHPVR